MSDRSPFERRTRAAQERLRAAGTAGLVSFPGSNCYYLSGFFAEPEERHLFLFVPAEGEPALVAPAMYANRIAEESWIEDVRTWTDGDDPMALVGTTAADLDVDAGRLLVDPRMWARFTQDLRTTLPAATWGLTDEVLAPLRVRKDDHELDALRRAAAVTDRVARDVRALGERVTGTTERELAREIERRLADAGGEGLAFDVIVAAGSDGAAPHHEPGDREIRRGDPVVLDFGARVDRYPADQTRTVVFAGDPPAGFEAAFEAVRAAQRAGIDAVEPGVTAGEVDRAARETIERHGFGDAFVHRTGHGVGLDVHEEPYVVAGSERELEPGMVFSVEPGVYRDAFGVRIEDLVVVTGDGCERLNDSPRGWRPASKSGA